MISRAAWALYFVVVLALGFGRTAEKIARDSGGLLSRYGPAVGAVALVAIVIAARSGRAVGPRPLWYPTFALLLLGSVGLAVLEAVIVVRAPAPWPIHAMIIGAILLLVPAQSAVWHACLGRTSGRTKGAPVSGPVASEDPRGPIEGERSARSGGRHAGMGRQGLDSK